MALDADTGKLRWHYQFTPHDVHDWDATEVPILADLTIAGQPRKVVMFANRNGFYYTLDRTTGKVIVAKPFVTTTWAKEIGSDGRPMLLPGHTPDEKGEVTCPDITGGTNFWPPTLRSRDAHVLRQRARSVHDLLRVEAGIQAGRAVHRRRRPARAERRDIPVYGALRAIDPATGERKWEFKYLNPSTAGLLTTASGLIFSGDSEGNLLALDSRSGKLLWRYQMGATHARHVADHLHARRPPARARARRHDADRVGTRRAVKLLDRTSP